MSYYKLIKEKEDEDNNNNRIKFCCEEMKRLTELVNSAQFEIDLEMKTIKPIGSWDWEDWDHEKPFQIKYCPFCGKKVIE